jgi:hypothetical protein
VTVLRIRYKLTIHARRERMLLAEDAALVAFHGNEIVAIEDEARALLHAEASSNLAASAQERFIEKPRRIFPQCSPARSTNSSASALPQDLPAFP